ncbi:hypothetical protein GN956_G13111 [Arapaima gigas]
MFYNGSYWSAQITELEVATGGRCQRSSGEAFYTPHVDDSNSALGTRHAAKDRQRWREQHNWYEEILSTVPVPQMIDGTAAAYLAWLLPHDLTHLRAPEY